MITKPELELKRDEIRQSRANYQLQIAACDGALKVIGEMILKLDEKQDDNDA